MNNNGFIIILKDLINLDLIFLLFNLIFMFFLSIGKYMRQILKFNKPRNCHYLNKILLASLRFILSFCKKQHNQLSLPNLFFLYFSLHFFKPFQFYLLINNFTFSYYFYPKILKLYRLILFISFLLVQHILLTMH